MNPVVIGDATLYLGDCREMLTQLDSASIDSIVCDPPYELGFMGKSWDNTGIANSSSMWTQCLRVLKPGGHLLAFSGSRTYHRMVCAIEDGGFEIRDQIMWIYGSGFPKSHNLADEWEGWGTALKPAHEPICVARKPFKGTVAANVRLHGTGAINIDACRVDGTPAFFRSNTNDIRGGRYAAGGSEYVPAPAEGHPLGRWPANIIHDGSPEVFGAFPDAPGQMADAKTNGDRKTANVYGAMRYAEPSADRVYATAGGTNFSMKPGARRLDSGSAARFFYCAKASRADRNEGIGGSDMPAVETEATMRDRETADWEERNGNHHPTVKPTDLMAYLCRLVTPPGGTVLDHFMGSGSTGKGAIREGFKFVGIDMTPEYVGIAAARIQFEIDRIAYQIAEASSQSCLFGEMA